MAIHHCRTCGFAGSEKIKSLKSSALSPRDFRTKADVSTILSKDGGRWGNIPIFYAVYYSAKLSVVKYMFEHNIEGTLNWRSDTGWTLLHCSNLEPNTFATIPYISIWYNRLGD